MKKLIFISLLPLFAIGQTKINLPTQSQYLGATGLGVITHSGVSIYKTNPSAAYQVLRTNSGNSAFEWVNVVDSVRKKAATDSVFYYKAGVAYFAFRDSAGTNGVTSIATGLGLTGGTITTTGTIAVDTANASILSRQRAANTYQPIGSYLTTAVTSVGSGYGISGGTITTTGTLTLDSATVYSALIRKKDSLTTYATKYAENLKVDSVKKKAASDTVFYYQNGSSHFAFRDSAGSGGVSTATSPLVVTGSNMTLNQITARDSLPNPKQSDILYTNFGSTALATNIDIDRIVGAQTLSSGAMYFTAITPLKTITCTGMGVFISTASNATETSASYVGFNLFTVSGANIVFNDSTTRDSALFDSGLTFKTKAWANGTKTLTAGTTYVVSLVWNNIAQVTAPTIGIATTLNNAVVPAFNFTNNRRINGIKNPQTTPYVGTNAWTNITSNSNIQFIFLY
jgi:hypothetical protein